MPIVGSCPPCGSPRICLAWERGSINPGQRRHLCLFVPGLSPLPGDYKVVGGCAPATPGTFTLRAVDNFTGAERFSGAVKTSPAYADYEFGTLHYDGSWPIRLVDWNAPGYYIESVGLIPVNVPSVPEVRGSSADSSDGWIPMYHTNSLPIPT